MQAVSLITDGLGIVGLLWASRVVGHLNRHNHHTGAGSRWIAVPFRVPDDCDDVEVETEVGQAGGVDTFFLTRLPEPQVDLRSAEFHDPLLGLAPVQPPPEKR